MKKIVKYISIVSLSVTLSTSCSLDTESMSSIDTQTFYRTMDDARLALVGCYQGYRNTVSQGPGMPFFIASEVMSDDCFGATGYSDNRAYQVIDRFDQSQSPADLNIFEDLWKLYYQAIFNCNSLLGQMDNIVWTADATFNCSSGEQTRNHVEGEVRFLRAIEYFDLVRLFERVPLLTVPTSDVVPQAEPSETYKLIFTDLSLP